MSNRKQGTSSMKKDSFDICLSGFRMWIDTGAILHQLIFKIHFIRWADFNVFLRECIRHVFSLSRCLCLCLMYCACPWHLYFLNNYYERVAKRGANSLIITYRPDMNSRPGEAFETLISPKPHIRFSCTFHEDQISSIKLKAASHLWGQVARVAWRVSKWAAKL